LKLLIGIVVLVLVLLQYVLWFGQSGYFARERLAGQLTHQEQRLAVLKQRNGILMAEVLALKADPTMLESRARKDLGMVKAGEVFYLIPSE
jgi:cell division protein FtsB